MCNFDYKSLLRQFIFLVKFIKAELNPMIISTNMNFNLLFVFQNT